MSTKRITYIVTACILSVGLLGAGYNIGKGLYKAKIMNRTVTVKGLAEHDVKSDLGLWEINYREVGNDLIQIYQRIQHDQEVVFNFLKEQGFAENEIDKTQLKVEDRFANIYNQSNTQNANDQRYVVTAGTRIRSEKVDLIQKSAQVVDKLIQQGITLNFEASFSPNPSFYYTKLDNVRPNMLAEATKSAYNIAAQFAKDTDTSLAGVQRASQGVFQIMGRDTSTMSADWNSNQNALGSIEKKVRLVTTIDYRLK